MVKRAEQVEGVVARGGVEREGEDRRAVGRTGIGVAGKRNRYRIAFGRQARRGAERVVEGDGAGRIGEEVRIQVARNAGRAEIGFIHRARAGADGRVVRVEDLGNAVRVDLQDGGRRVAVAVRQDIGELVDSVALGGREQAVAVGAVRRDGQRAVIAVDVDGAGCGDSNRRAVEGHGSDAVAVVFGQVVGSARAAVETGDDVAGRGDVFGIEAVEVVVGRHAVVEDGDVDEGIGRVAVRVGRDDAEVQQDAVVMVARIRMVERAGQVERVSARRGIDGDGKDGHAVGDAGIGIAGQRHGDGEALGGQRRAGAEAAIKSDGAGAVAEEVGGHGIAYAHGAGRQVGFVNRLRLGRHDLRRVVDGLPQDKRLGLPVGRLVLQRRRRDGADGVDVVERTCGKGGAEAEAATAGAAAGFTRGRFDLAQLGCGGQHFAELADRKLGAVLHREFGEARAAFHLAVVRDDNRAAVLEADDELVAVVFHGGGFGHVEGKIVFIAGLQLDDDVLARGRLLDEVGGLRGGVLLGGVGLGELRAVGAGVERLREFREVDGLTGGQRDSRRTAFSHFAEIPDDDRSAVGKLDDQFAVRAEAHALNVDAGRRKNKVLSLGHCHHNVLACLDVDGLLCAACGIVCCHIAVTPVWMDVSM